MNTVCHNNKIASKVFAVFAANPVKMEMRKAFACLQPHFLGPEKCLISFDYKKLVGTKKFAQMLIHNNKFHNNTTVIPIRNVHPDVLNHAYEDSSQPFEERNWCLHQSLLEKGVCLIKNTKETNSHGKYLCVVSTKIYDIFVCSRSL